VVDSGEISIDVVGAGDNDEVAAAEFKKYIATHGSGAMAS
jgi:hypothetical protein